MLVVVNSLIDGQLKIPFQIFYCYYYFIKLFVIVKCSVANPWSFTKLFFPDFTPVMDGWAFGIGSMALMQNFTEQMWSKSVTCVFTPHCLQDNYIQTLMNIRMIKVDKQNGIVNISQIKHTWFSFISLFVADLSNYNAVVFTGKKARKNRRRTGIHTEHEKGITEQSIYGKSHKEYKKPTYYYQEIYVNGPNNFAISNW